jgi:hypothetical protein
MPQQPQLWYVKSNKLCKYVITNIYTYILQLANRHNGVILEEEKFNHLEVNGCRAVLEAIIHFEL